MKTRQAKLGASTEAADFAGGVKSTAQCLVGSLQHSVDHYCIHFWASCTSREDPPGAHLCHHPDVCLQRTQWRSPCRCHASNASQSRGFRWVALLRANAATRCSSLSRRNRRPARLLLLTTFARPRSSHSMRRPHQRTQIILCTMRVGDRGLAPISGALYRPDRVILADKPVCVSAYASGTSAASQTLASRSST